jgi:hypothetical protein
MIISCSITWHVPTSLSLHTLSIDVSTRVSSIIQNQTRAFNEQPHGLRTSSMHEQPRRAHACAASSAAQASRLSNRGPSRPRGLPRRWARSLAAAVRAGCRSLGLSAGRARSAAGPSRRRRCAAMPARLAEGESAAAPMQPRCHRFLPHSSAVLCCRLPMRMCGASCRTVTRTCALARCCRVGA